MKKKVRGNKIGHYILTGILIVLMGVLVSGQTTLSLSQFSLAGTSSKTEIPTKSAEKSDFPNQPEIYPLNFNNKIYGLSIDADIELVGDAGILRIILVDKNKKEYLVYEAYPLLTDTGKFSVAKICEETCILNGIIPDYLRIDKTDASIAIKKVYMIDTQDKLSSAAKSAGVENYAAQIDKEQEIYKISQLNKLIKQKGLSWTAGETSVSKMSYAEKKKLLVGEINETTKTIKSEWPSGIEYYKDGIFEVESNVEKAAKSTETTDYDMIFPDSFDWRKVHGENWMTSVKDQTGCPSCWAHCALGITEAGVNINYNQHLDFDLSEQDLNSCSGCGSCEKGGGSSYQVLKDYLTLNGVIDESCFPYSKTDESCKNKCINPTLNVKIPDAFYISTEDQTDMNTIKYSLMNYGPATFSSGEWGHCRVLVGWEKDIVTGRTIWNWKNSWGIGWGENGYGESFFWDGQEEEQNIEFRFIDKESMNKPELIKINEIIRSIQCTDKDGDNYCNWGISETKPSTCAASCKVLKDCDDSNNTLGPFISDKNYNCCEIGKNCPDIICKVDQKIGDLNNDGEIDSSDVDIIRDLIGSRVIMPSNKCCIDTNKDGKVDDLDMQGIIAASTDESLNYGECGFCNNDGVCNTLLETCNCPDCDGVWDSKGCKFGECKENNCFCMGDNYYSDDLNSCLSTSCYKSQRVGNLDSYSGIGNEDIKILGQVQKDLAAGKINLKEECCFDINSDGVLDEKDISKLKNELNAFEKYCPYECYPGQKAGDLFWDGVLNSDDVDFMNKIVLGKMANPSDICCSDINRDGKVDDLDMQVLTNMAYNLEFNRNINNNITYEQQISIKWDGGKYLAVQARNDNYYVVADKEGVEPGGKGKFQFVGESGTIKSGDIILIRSFFNGNILEAAPPWINVFKGNDWIVAKDASYTSRVSIKKEGASDGEAITCGDAVYFVAYDNEGYFWDVQTNKDNRIAADGSKNLFYIYNENGTCPTPLDLNLDSVPNCEDTNNAGINNSYNNASSCLDLLNENDCIDSSKWTYDVLRLIEINSPYPNAPADFCTGEPYSESIPNYPDCTLTLKCGCVWDEVSGCVGSVWPVYTNSTAEGCGA